MQLAITIRNAYQLFFRHLFSVYLACLAALLIYPLAHGGITTDGSMGPATTLIPTGPTGQDYTIPADLGQQKGANLFHSFRDFNVNTGERATFTGPSDTANIIGRVTGGSSSWIDGLLACSITGANIWLLNPFGILFGPNASLDVKGSFHASTADYLQLSDGGVFYTDPSKTSKLSTAPPSAFGFLSSKPADIDISGSSLVVPEGEIISIVGGDIRIENGHLVILRGRVNLASLGSPGTVEIESDGLKVEASNGLGDISISNSENASDIVNIDVSGSDFRDVVSGSVDIYCKDFSLNHSDIRSINYSNLYKGGKIRLVAEESASLDNLSTIYNGCGNKGSGGDIDIQTGYFTLSTGSHISALTYGSGNSGDISIKAKDALIGAAFESSDSLTPSKVTCQTMKGSTGNAGNLNIDTESLTLTKGGQISASTYGSGDAGHVNINAKDVLIDGVFEESSKEIHPSMINCQTDPGSTGNAGSLSINTKSLILSNGGQISASTFGSGDAGDVNIKAKDVLMEGVFENSVDNITSLILCRAESGSAGNAGNLNIDTESLTLTNGGQISASTSGIGNAGNVNINAKDVLIDGGIQISNNAYNSMIECQTQKDSAGNAGNLNIDTESLTLTNGGQISASTLGIGNAGNVNINAKDVLIDGGFESSRGFQSSSFQCQANPGSTGNAGNLNIDTETLTLANGGQISASTSASGNAGNVNINAKDVLIDGGFNNNKELYYSMIALRAEQNSTGNAGNLNIDTKSLTMSNGGQISAVTIGSGHGGDVTVNTIDELHLNYGAVISSASKGTGDAGDITLNTGKLEIRDSLITTTSVQADGGDITITTGFLTWLVDSAIATSVDGGPQTTGGNIRINSPYVVLNDSQVIANAYEGKGGSIGITAGTYLADWTSTVSASSTLGISGQVDINSPLVNLSGLLSPLPAAFVDISELLADDCETRYKRHKASSLIIRGRDALPAQPGDLWPSPVIMQ